jgi:hypothetical protein
VNDCREQAAVAPALAEIVGRGLAGKGAVAVRLGRTSVFAGVVVGSAETQTAAHEMFEPSVKQLLVSISPCVEKLKLSK